jgi:hypothetical protein
MVWQKNEMPEPPPSRLACGLFLGWAALGVVNAVVIAACLPLPRGGLGVRFFHHVYDAGHTLAAALLSAAAVEAWQRWGPRRPLLGYAALTVASLAVGAAVLSEDLSVLASKIPGPLLLWQGALVSVIALTVPVAAAMTMAVVERPTPAGGSWLTRLWARRSSRALPSNPGLRALTGLLGLALAVANHFVLANDYPGVHLFCAWIAAIVVGIAASIDLPVLLSRRGRFALRAGLSLVVASTIAVRPQNRVAVELGKLSGESLTPWVLRAHLAAVPLLSTNAGEWFTNRGARPPLPPPPSPLLPKGAIVILITVDALRADVVSSAANEAQLPSFAALRRESVEFAQARSAASGTSGALASLFSGRYFSQLHWTQYPGDLICPYTDTSPRFPDILASSGVATVTFTGMPGLLNAFGIVHGFQEERLIPGKPWATAEMIITPLLNRLRAQGPGPLFLYAHLTDAHSPYDLAGKDGTSFERYLREVALVDLQIGRIRRALSELHLEDRAALIVSADHGEAFGEHGVYYHATTVYDELLHVPLLVRAPGVRPRVVQEPVSLIDVSATVLDMMGAPTPGTFMGQSLVPYLRGASPALTRPLAVESSRGLRAMIFPDNRKIIHDKRKGTYQLYDLSADPGEITDLADMGGSAADARLEILSAFFYVHELHLSGYEPPFVR